MYSPELVYQNHLHCISVHHQALLTLIDFFLLYDPDPHDPSIFNASVNVPFGLDYHEGMLFVAIPRRNPGIPATLNVVELVGSVPHINPLLKGYPDYQTNALNVS